MNKRHLTSTCLFLVSTSNLFLSACVSTTNSPDAAAPSVVIQKKVEPPPPPTYQATPGLTPKERFSKGILHLEVGEVEMAKAEFEAYIQAVPSSATAKQLLRQINTPADEYFQSDYFTITLESGQNLSTLAQDYLGSALDFFALAKYNDITNARRILIGQEIKIPATERALAKRAQGPTAANKANNDNVDETIEEISGASNNTSDGIKPEVAAKISSSSSEQLAANLPRLIDEKYYSDAFAMLQQIENNGDAALVNDETRYTIISNYAESVSTSSPQNAANLFTQTANYHKRSGDEVGHFKYLEKASEITPNDYSLTSEVISLKKALSENYHRIASTEFRAQNLDAAIANWDKALTIDPNYNSAIEFRQRAVELKKRLEALQK